MYLGPKQLKSQARCTFYQFIISQELNPWPQRF